MTHHPLITRRLALGGLLAATVPAAAPSSRPRLPATATTNPPRPPAWLAAPTHPPAPGGTGAPPQATGVFAERGGGARDLVA